jgi:hypothetical protein
MSLSEQLEDIFGTGDKTKGKSVVLRGASSICEFIHRCGRDRKPARQTLGRWQKEYPDFPVQKDSDGCFLVRSNALKNWLLKRGKIPPRTTDELDALSDGIELTDQDLLSGLSDSQDIDLDDFLDQEIFNDYPEPTGDVEDELAEARKLRYLFGRIIFSWRLEKLGSPKIVKSFQDFASGLTRQIAVIGRLEEGLQRQRLRNGKTLDEATVLGWSRSFGNYVTEKLDDLSNCLFEIVDEEVGRLASERGLDFSLNSDKMLKLFDQQVCSYRTQIADGAVELARKFQSEQVERLGGEEEPK